MAQFQNIDSLKQSLDAQRNNLKKLDEDIKRLKSEGADSNNISQKEEKLENDTIEYNSNMDILNEYKKLEEGIKKIKDLEEKKNDFTDYPTCYALDKQILEEQNLLELSYLLLCNNIQDLKNNKEISDIIFNTPKQVNANKIDASSDKDFDFPELREKLKGMNKEHEKRISKLKEELKKAENQDGKHSPEYLQIESNIESEKSYIHDKEEMISAISNLEEISKDYINEAIKKEKEKLERYKKDLKELPKEATQSLIKLYNKEINLINQNIDMLENESKDIDEYNLLILDRKNLDIKIRDKNGFEAHKYARERYLKDREINAIAGKLSTYDYTNAIILGSPTKEKEQKKEQPSPTTATTTTTPKPSTSKTGSNISSDVISEMQKYYDELIKEGNLVGPQKFAGNGYASEVNAVKNALAANGVVVESTKVSNDLNNQPIPNTPEKTSGTNENSKPSSSSETTKSIKDMSDTEFEEMINNLFSFDDFEEAEVTKAIEEEPETIEEDPEEEFEEVIETKPCSWIKAHKKQILIGAGITALSIAAVLLIAQVLPAVTAALKTKSILTITNQMMANGAQWKLSSAAQKAVLHGANEALAAGLKGSFFNPTSGIWTIAGTNLTDFAGAAALKHAAALSKLSVLVPGVSVTSLLGSAAIYAGKKLDKNRSPIYTAIDKVIIDMKKEEIDSLAEIDVKSKAIQKQIESNIEMTKEEKERLTNKLNKVTKKKKAKLEKKTKEIDKGKGQNEEPNKTKDPLLELESFGINIDGLSEEDKKEIRDIMNQKTRELSEFTVEEIEELKELIEELKGVSK